MTEMVHVPKPLNIAAIGTGEQFEITTPDGRSTLATLNDIRQVVPGGDKCSTVELIAFAGFCIRHHLDPLARQVHLIKYSDRQPAAYVASYNVYIERGAGHPQFDGFQSGVVWRLSDGTAKRGGMCEHVPGEDAEIAGGWCIVHRKDRSLPVDVEVPFAEAVQTRYDKATGAQVPNANWSPGGKPLMMIRKCAESQAFRKAFPELLGDLYSDAEPITPTYTDSAVLDAPTREQRQLMGDKGEGPLDPEPVDQAEAERIAQLGRLCGRIKTIMAMHGVGELDRDGLAQSLASAAVACVGGDRDAFLSNAAWTLDLIEAVNGYLDDHGDDLAEACTPCKETDNGDSND